MFRTCQNTRLLISRRDVLRHSASGFGAVALAALHAQWAQGQAVAPSPYRSPLAPKPPHLPAKAKRVIFLFMEGGPSHVDTFDQKPELARAGGRYLPGVFPFERCGKSGLPIADVFPHLSRHADELCLLNGMTTKTPGHQQAIVALHTGAENFVRPSLGSWVVYGLGTVAEDLPGFVTINPVGHLGGAQNYGSAFLPATYQGTKLLSGAASIPNVVNRHLSNGDQRRQLDFVRRANQRFLATDPGHPELEGLIESYEMAFKMQTSVPQTLDVSGEPEAVRELYGLDDGTTSQFGLQCLMARRLAEKGVRFIQLTSNGWDHHHKLKDALAGRAAAIDKPIAGLIADLKRLGMLKDTLIVWGGEFGRTPREDGAGGRGHANRGYSMWMAGGGVKGGLRYGSTDDLGENAATGKMSTHDLHATILHLLGLDHEKLTYKFAGRDFRLTDTKGDVATDILL
ncbi:DUF1501 domain-containing protein [Humisphaera borealis]|uniref:DUF1501 domain-containing protein n=1 Tax=Humisphaera borealis TaxID=2807512 RepID=A0A7M2WRZ2_9BACT|nr:DUF1501 domain-containing protein [Humisphaera borealis]QOV88236.1 DUF1501 domain-containing protein [Humisphaera borealis]